MSKLSEKLKACDDWYVSGELADEAAALEWAFRSLTETNDRMNAHFLEVLAANKALEAELADLRSDAQWVREQRIKIRDRLLALSRVENLEAEAERLREVALQQGLRIQDLEQELEDWKGSCR